MLNRWIGILSAAGMIVAHAAIVTRDVVPDWFAGDPPPSDAVLFCPGEERFVQVGIYDDAGRTLGRSWTSSKRPGVGGFVFVSTRTILHPLYLPGGVTTPRVRIETHLTYRANTAQVDQLDFKMFGLGVPIWLNAQAMPSGEFPGQWRVGPKSGKFGLDSMAPAALGDVIRPFDRLPDLYVGRCWRLKLLDPLAQMLPQLDAAGLRPDAVMIKVTGRKVIEHRGRRVETFVVEVEGGGARAWVGPDGRVLKQEVNVPLLGRLILRDEPYDEQARQQAFDAVPDDHY